MTKIIITIKTENAAFGDPYEIQRILQKYAPRITEGEECVLLDINGNKVGKVEIE